MKNLHYLKKFVVMVLAAMMTLSTFAMPTFAADPVNKASFTVSGLDANANSTELKAYKIVSIKTGEGRGGFVQVVEKTDPLYIEDVEHPTYDEIMALVAEAGKTDSKLGDGVAPATVASGVATWNNMDPGMYIVTIKNKIDASVVYNPVLVSINLKDGNGDAQNGTIAIADDTTYNLEGGGQLKKTEIPFKKVVDRDNNKHGNDDTNKDNAQTDNDDAIVDGDGDGTDDGNLGDTAGLNDKVWFRINTMVPDYADNFFKAHNEKINHDPEFYIYDTLSKGLDLDAVTDTSKIEVYDLSEPDATKQKLVEGTDYIIPKTGVASQYGENSTAYPKTGTAANAAITAKKFFVELTPAGVLKLRGHKIEVRYSATVNGTHGYNFNPETNTAGFKYTRNPGEDCNKGEEKTTYHYTFTINGGVRGPETEENREIIKVGTDESGDFVLKETDAIIEKGWRPLEGATFTLKKKNAEGNYVDYSTGKDIKSDKDGIIRGIERIDAGEYQLIETAAPEGFATNTTPIPFRIHAILDNEGRMTRYQVYVTTTSGAEVCVGDYKVTYSDTVNPDPTNIGTVDYMNGNAAATKREIKYLVQKKAEAGKPYMDENGETKTAEGGEPMYKKVTENGEEKIVPDTEEVPKEDFGEAADIRNSKVGTLPSTGGMGTVLFTIGGAAIMALALFLLFGGKKKQHQK